MILLQFLFYLKKKTDFCIFSTNILKGNSNTIHFKNRRQILHKSKLGK